MNAETRPPDVDALAELEEERRLGASEGDAWGIVASVVLCLDEFVSKR